VATEIMNLFPQPKVAGADLNKYFRNADLTDNANRFSTGIREGRCLHPHTWSVRELNSPGLFPGLANGTHSCSQGAYHLTADTP
jgi:hypothetical protein